MKKRILGFLSIPLFFLVGCTNKDVALSGTITTKEVEIEDIKDINVSLKVNKEKLSDNVNKFNI